MINDPKKPSAPQPLRRSDSEWAQAKVWESVRRAALAGAAELQVLAAQLAGPRR